MSLADNDIEDIQAELIAYGVDGDNAATSVNALEKQAGQWDYEGHNVWCIMAGCIFL